MSDQDQDNRKIIKKFPVICSLSLDECTSAGRYMDLVPDSKKGCIVYFENELPSVPIKEEGDIKFWKSQLRLVCWVNQKKLGKSECSITGQVFQTFFSAFPEMPFNNGNFQRCQITITGQDSINYNPFAKYSYDEEKTKLQMYPYDYFSCLIDISYGLNKACIEEFTKQPEIPC